MNRTDNKDRGVQAGANHAVGRVGAFVQARMSSRRFPGKVLAPFHGLPLIRHVVAAVEATAALDFVVVTTSDDVSDDPLATYLQSLEIKVFRGPLENVYERFRRAWQELPCTWILRICADSPLLNPAELESVIRSGVEANCDLATTRLQSNYPKGRNADLFKAATFLSVDDSQLTENDREHIVTYFLDRRQQYAIKSVELHNPALANEDLTVDTPEDLCRLENLLSPVTRRAN